MGLCFVLIIFLKKNLLIDILEDGLSADRNMQWTCEGIKRYRTEAVLHRKHKLNINQHYWTVQVKTAHSNIPQCSEGFIVTNASCTVCFFLCFGTEGTMLWTLLCLGAHYIGDSISTGREKQTVWYRKV